MSKLVNRKSQNTTVVSKPKVEEVIKPTDTNEESTAVTTEDEDQEIIEVSQDEVKKALKTLLSKHNDVIGLLYAKHDEYNKQYFGGQLSVPIITIDKMSNKTLGSYNHGQDNTGLENHIYMNRNFIALNTETRILETLRHEMIHQYQDEVLYEKKDKAGNLIHSGAKRPADWHNKDFREWAERVGIVANGKNCTGNPAHMPEAKSYNRKFACGCVATNGYPVTIWSTREIFAVCKICGRAFKELKKSGGTIAVKSSTIEKNGEDIVEIAMRKTYSNFEKFGSKKILTDRTKELKKDNIPYEEGIYSKGHNAYAKGYYYWVAYNDLEVEAKEQSDMFHSAIIGSIDVAQANIEALQGVTTGRTSIAQPNPTKPCDIDRAVMDVTTDIAGIKPPSTEPCDLTGVELPPPAKKRGRKPKAQQEPTEDQPKQDVEVKTEDPAPEAPKKKRGRPAGTKNKDKGEVQSDTGNAEQA